MLRSITINNIALIDNLTINFSTGLNVLSGETGAGKSLIIDSISLLLGERADKTLISFGEKEAYVEAVFVTENQTVADVLEGFGVSFDGEIIISRKITVDGKNECRVNGKSFTLSMLKNITTNLLDLHGQFQHQSLLDPANHLLVLDSFATSSIEPNRELFAEKLEKYREISNELNKYTIDEKEREHLIDLYRYQINEIKTANFKEGEIEELKDKQIKLSHSERIKQALDSAFNLLAGESNQNATALIRKAETALADASQFDSELLQTSERLKSLLLDAQDISETIYDKFDSYIYSSEEVNEVGDRLDLFSSFKKKYGLTVSEINEYLSKIEEQLNNLTNCSETVERLISEKNAIEAELIKVGAKLTEVRKREAERFSERVKIELSEVGLNGSKFYAEITPLSLSEATPNGIDHVEFMFSANVGQPPKPLTKVISGGEMSRFMLALKSITADNQNIETMIFDEIDTGVSGYMAKVLAHKMKAIGARHQVLCVTHMAQICAHADQNFYINKLVANGKTRTNIKLLDGEEKVYEVARLIGDSNSNSAIAHARDIISEIGDLKN